VTGRRNPTRIASGVTYRDAERPLGTCATGQYDTEMWTVEKTRLTDNNQAAIHLCHTCPIHDWCATQPTNPGTIQAGIHTPHGNRDGRRKTDNVCGSSAGYTRHRNRGEEACRPCLNAEAASTAARRARKTAA
jgi:hypothetical protein